MYHVLAKRLRFDWLHSAHQGTIFPMKPLRSSGGLYALHSAKAQSVRTPVSRGHITSPYSCCEGKCDGARAANRAMDGHSTAPDASLVLTNTLAAMGRSPSPVMARTLSSEAGQAGLQGHYVAGADGLQRQQVAPCVPCRPGCLACHPLSPLDARGFAPPATCCDPHRGAAIFPSCERRLAAVFVRCCAGLDGARLLYFR